MRIMLKKSDDPKLFSLEFDPSKTVKQLKERLLQENKQFVPVKELILTYEGNMLSDDRSLEHYKYQPDKYIVVVVVLPEKRTAPARRPSQALQRTIEHINLASPVASTSKASHPFVPINPPKKSKADIDQKMVFKLVEMGFIKSEAIAALKAACNDVDLAVDYLLNGMPQTSGKSAPTAGPSHSQAPPTTSICMKPSSSKGQSSSEGPSSSKGPSSSMGQPSSEGHFLDFLKDQPEFRMIKKIVWERPEVRHILLQQIRRGNANLYRLIMEHQEEFYRLLEQPDSEEY